MDFVREPRLPVPPMPTGETVVEAPPQVPTLTPGNPVARLLPAAVLVAAVGMMAVYFMSGAATVRNPMYLFFPVMMLTSVIGTLAYSARGAHRTADVNRNRTQYLRYLDALDVETAAAAEAHCRALQWSQPDTAALWTLVGGPRMWERRSDDPDFLDVRLGVGVRNLSPKLVAPELDAVEEQDPVTVSAMSRLIDLRSTTRDLPVSIALREIPAVTVDGEAATALVRAMVCQLAVLHGPDDVGIIAAGGGTEWEWLKWLPHSSPTDPPPRHAVVIADGSEESARVEQTHTVIAVGAARPVAHGCRLRVDTSTVTILHADGAVDTARPDLMTRSQALVCARRLARYRRAVTVTSRGWPELMHIEDVGRWDPEHHWGATDSGCIRPVPIGVAEDGAAVHLDINEAARNGIGPHGLCIGATGSGKSEFLRTLALGMIVAHSPETLNLVLVDFKGGATFLGLEKAHHVAAVITNLADEAHLVSRMSDALAGELNRRQELLRSAGRFANVTEYERARSQGQALPPLPALFIMVDEFSELLSQHPDFAELFVAIGRLGRSLGMHLLLASQRLDEGRLRGLETHLSYRVCLKTFSASESRAVLGVPDAYHLPAAPGAAYLKTTDGDLVRFQTAFVSEPQDDDAAHEHPCKPRLFTASFRDTAPTPRSGRALLDTVMDRVIGHGTPAHQVWLPPLTASPTLDMLATVVTQNPLTVPIGVVDNPYEQRRDALVADLSGAAGNVAIVGAPGAGKSTALRTLLLALAERHSPSEMGFYCLDFGGGALSGLRRLPHVGSMAGRAEVDLCRRTIAVVAGILRSREVRFRRLGIDSMSDYRRRRAANAPDVSADDYGDVFLVVDGWATLRQEFDGLEETVTAIAAQGLSFGVHVVITASRWAELRPAVKDQIATRVELRLGDPADSEMDRKRARELSDRPPGHGITASRRELVIALARWDGRCTTTDLAEAVAAHCEHLRDRWAGHCAPPVRLLPTRVLHQALVASSGNRPVIGLGERELQPIALSFDDHPHLLVLGEPGCGKTAALRLLCREIVRTRSSSSAQLEIVDFRRTLLGVVESEHLGGYAMSPVSLTARLTAVIETLEARMPGEDVTQEQLRTRSWWSGPDIFLVIDDYDLAAGVTGNPLARLADLLPHATDLGLHLIVARRSGGAARAMFDPVLARLRELGCMGLMMSASPDEGVLLGTVRPASLPPGRATLIRRTGDELVQVAWTDPP